MNGKKSKRDINPRYMIETGRYHYEDNRVSAEFFSPGPHSLERTATAPSAIFNLVSTIIGGGVLSLPYAFDKCGLVLSVIFMVIAAAASNFSLYVIVSCSRRGSATSYEEVVSKALGPRAGLITLILLIALTFLTLVAYVILTRDLVATLSEQFLFGHAISKMGKNLLTVGCIIAISPVLFAKSMDSLRFTSIFSLISVFVLALAISIRALNNTREDEMVFREIKVFPTSWKDPLYAFPIICVSFLCHFNVLPVYRELHKPTRRRLKKIVSCTMFSTWIFYMLVGGMGYWFAYRLPEGILDDILNNFARDDHLVNVGRMGLLVTIILSMPLIIQPCRSNTYRFVTHFQSSLTKQNERTGLLGTDFSEIRGEMHIILTVGIIGSAVTLAFALPGVAVVWNVMGSTVGLLISYVLPCISYITIRYEKPNTDKRKLTAWIIFIFGTFVSILCTIQSIISVFNY